MTSDMPPDTKRLTYQELGTLRGISRQSAERLARRRKWPKQIGNDGITRVDVPADWATLESENPDDPRGRRVDPVPALRAAVEELREQGSVMRDQLQRETARADKAEGEAEALRDDLQCEMARADKAQAELEMLRDELRVRGVGLWSRLLRRARA